MNLNKKPYYELRLETDGGDVFAGGVFDVLVQVVHVMV